MYTIGETVYDIIFRDGRIEAGKPGGSMLNASVSLGRLGVPVCFITELGNDDLGGIIAGFLSQNGVDTSFITTLDHGQTPLALGFLDEEKNARYTFYKDYPEKRLQQSFPEVRADDLLLFGSFFSISPAVRNPLIKFVRQAAKAGAIIIYDPNIRRPHQRDLPQLLPMIRENMGLADIVRASDEDFRVMLDIYSAEDAFSYLQNTGRAALIYTSGGKMVKFIGSGIRIDVKVPPAEVVSTVGAGDNFNAGLLWSFLSRGIRKGDIANISSTQWDAVLRVAISFGSHVCGSYDNYISRDFARQIISDH